MMQEITSSRANPLVDPALSVWQGEVVWYLFLGGLVAGLMVILGLWTLRGPERPHSRALSLLAWAAPVLLSVGMLFLWLDLENRFNVWRFYVAFRVSSPMSWGAWILLAIYPASIALAWTMTPADLQAAALRRLPWGPWLSRLGQCAIGRVRRVSIVNVVLGAALGVYTGVLLGTMAARPLWNSALLGPLFLASGLSTGAAFLLMWRLDDAERRTLGRADMGLILVEIALIAAWLGDLAVRGAASRDAAWLLLGGPYTAAFWTLVVTLGLVAPLAGEWLEHRHRTVPGRFAAVLVLVGGLALRWILVSAGQAAGWAADLAAR